MDIYPRAIPELHLAILEDWLNERLAWTELGRRYKIKPAEVTRIVYSALRETVEMAIAEHHGNYADGALGEESRRLLLQLLLFRVSRDDSAVEKVQQKERRAKSRVNLLFSTLALEEAEEILRGDS